MADHEDTLERVVESLKEPVRVDPDLDRRVMAVIERLPSPVADAAGPRAWLDLLTRRRTIRLSPAGGFAVAAGLIALALAGGRIVRPPAMPTAPDASSALEPGEVTQFVLVAPEAASVAVVGDFNGWSLSATPLVRQAGDNVWWVTLPLRPGRYRYAFVVDGTDWHGDPNAPAADDEFGRPNSVITIGGA